MRLPHPSTLSPYLPLCKLSTREKDDALPLEFDIFHTPYTFLQPIKYQHWNIANVQHNWAVIPSCRETLRI
jgi:hypothetical protein